ncbi:MAG: hypothetical protein LLF94_08000 [Chlamydiales bacterium]|nr:hypothetical protein [Chlamydiales bacterium]
MSLELSRLSNYLKTCTETKSLLLLNQDFRKIRQIQADCPEVQLYETFYPDLTHLFLDAVNKITDELCDAANSYKTIHKGYANPKHAVKTLKDFSILEDTHFATCLTGRMSVQGRDEYLKTQRVVNEAFSELHEAYETADKRNPPSRELSCLAYNMMPDDAPFTCKIIRLAALLIRANKLCVLQDRNRPLSIIAEKMKAFMCARFSTELSPELLKSCPLSHHMVLLKDRVLNIKEYPESERLSDLVSTFDALLESGQSDPATIALLQKNASQIQTHLAQASLRMVVSEFRSLQKLQRLVLRYDNFLSAFGATLKDSIPKWQEKRVNLVKSSKESLHLSYLADLYFISKELPQENFHEFITHTFHTAVVCSLLAPLVNYSWQDSIEGPSSLICTFREELKKENVTFRLKVLVYLSRVCSYQMDKKTKHETFYTEFERELWVKIDQQLDELPMSDITDCYDYCNQRLHGIVGGRLEIYPALYKMYAKTHQLLGEKECLAIDWWEKLRNGNPAFTQQGYSFSFSGHPLEKYEKEERHKKAVENHTTDYLNFLIEFAKHQKPDMHIQVMGIQIPCHSTVIPSDLPVRIAAVPDATRFGVLGILYCYYRGYCGSCEFLNFTKKWWEPLIAALHPEFPEFVKEPHLAVPSHIERYADNWIECWTKKSSEEFGPADTVLLVGSKRIPVHRDLIAPSPVLGSTFFTCIYSGTYKQTDEIVLLPLADEEEQISSDITLTGLLIHLQLLYKIEFLPELCERDFEYRLKMTQNYLYPGVEPKSIYDNKDIQIERDMKKGVWQLINTSDDLIEKALRSNISPLRMLYIYESIFTSASDKISYFKWKLVESIKDVDELIELSQKRFPKCLQILRQIKPFCLEGVTFDSFDREVEIVSWSSQNLEKFTQAKMAFLALGDLNYDRDITFTKLHIRTSNILDNDLSEIIEIFGKDITILDLSPSQRIRSLLKVPQNLALLDLSGTNFTNEAIKELSLATGSTLKTINLTGCSHVTSEVLTFFPDTVHVIL